MLSYIDLFFFFVLFSSALQILSDAITGPTLNTRRWISSTMQSLGFCVQFVLNRRPVAHRWLRGTHNKHPADASPQKPFPDGCLHSPVAVCGHNNDSIHHFPCITSSEQTQRSSYSGPLRREHRATDTSQLGWLGRLHASKYLRTTGQEIEWIRRMGEGHGYCIFPPNV